VFWSPGRAGLIAVVDPLVGGIRMATPEEIGALTAGAGGAMSLTYQEPDPVVIRLADGTLKARVPDRLMMNVTARRDAQGHIKFSCDQGAHAPALPSTWEEK
jgi:hypothetical protein